jgi:hypothetical protein
MRRQPERVEQRHIVQLLRSVGAHVWVIGTTRRTGDYQGTMMTPGMVDIVSFLPRGLGVLFVEVKAPKGRLRLEQDVFRACCEETAAPFRVHHVVGGLDAVIGTLIGLGVLKAENVAHYRVAAN